MDGPSCLTMPSGTPTKLRVIIVRHGETRENVERIIQGQLDTDLNDRGRLQADITGRYLATIHIDRIIASPLKRAADTARAIHQHQRAKGCNLELEFDDRLKERSFGVLEGRVYRGGSNKPEDTEGIERMEPFSERLASFWNDLVTRTVSTDEEVGKQADRTETVVLVSHGGAISALMNQVLVPGRYCLLSPEVVPSRFWNCSLTELLVPVLYTSSTFPPGDRSRKSSWSIRPIHLGVQGSQFLLDHELQKKLLASALSADTPKRSQAADDAVNDLQAAVHKTASELERDPHGRKQLEEDTIKAPDGTTVENDIGYGKGVGVVLRWSDVEHLKDLDNHSGATSVTTSTISSGASSNNINVDELIK